MDNKVILIPEFDPHNPDSKKKAGFELLFRIHNAFKSDSISGLPSLKECLKGRAGIEKAYKVWQEGGYQLEEGKTPCGLDVEEAVRKMLMNADIIGIIKQKMGDSDRWIDQKKLQEILNRAKDSYLEVLQLLDDDDWKRILGTYRDENLIALTDLEPHHVEELRKTRIKDDGYPGNALLFLLNNDGEDKRRNRRAFAMLKKCHLEIASEQEIIDWLVADVDLTEAFSSLKQIHIDAITEHNDGIYNLFNGSRDKRMEAFSKLNVEQLKEAKKVEVGGKNGIIFLIKYPTKITERFVASPGKAEDLKYFINLQIAASEAGDQFDLITTGT